ncbi:hypothetical protein CSC76_16635 [Pseudoxanthomonas mexicana]|nr:hypothetical protein CSC76_16635 [Pseudoxanthomonas mexicana]
MSAQVVSGKQGVHVLVAAPFQLHRERARPRFEELIQTLVHRQVQQRIERDEEHSKQQADAKRQPPEEAPLERGWGIGLRG